MVSRQSIRYKFFLRFAYDAIPPAAGQVSQKLISLRQGRGLLRLNDRPLLLGWRWRQRFYFLLLVRWIFRELDRPHSGMVFVIVCRKCFTRFPQRWRCLWRRLLRNRCGVLVSHLHLAHIG